MTSTTASTITARDFSDRTTDTLRDRWTQGKMRHVVAALDGRPVVVVLEAGTGFTMVGVRLLGVRDNFYGGAGRVLVESTFEDGTTSVLAYRLEDVGPIVELEGPVVGGGVRFRAVETYRAEVSAAIRFAQERHGKPEGRNWGAWRVGYVGADFLDVTYEPHTGNPAAADYAGGCGERGYWRIMVRDLEAATV
jgi:hypothetical protein